MRLKRKNELSKDITRAVLRYPGAKWRIADFILQHMPEQHSYLETFWGAIRHRHGDNVRSKTDGDFMGKAGGVR